jgi:glucose dehydrogenase
MGRAYGTNKKRAVYRILERKPEGKRPLGRLRHGWVDNIKVDLRGVGWGCMDCIDLAQDRDQWKSLVNTVMDLWVPYNLGKFLSS